MSANRSQFNLHRLTALEKQATVFPMLPATASHAVGLTRSVVATDTGGYLAAEPTWPSKGARLSPGVQQPA